MVELIKPILPEMILFFGACLILLLDVFQKFVVHLMSLSSVVLILCIVAIVLGVPDGVYYHNLFAISMFTRVFKLALLTFALFQSLATSALMDKYALNKNEHSVMVLFLIVGACVMISANHLMLLYVGMEIQALAAYTLVVMQRKSEFSAEAGVKYFILGSLASVLYLLGTSYLYGSYNTLYLYEITTAMKAGSTAGVLGSILVMCTFLFKIGSFPFHQWVPDVYQGAPTPSTSIISTLSKVTAIAVLLKLIVGLCSENKSLDINGMLSVIAILSMIVGAVVPISQTHMKRFLGYSSVGHAGFMLMGIVNIHAVGVSSIIVYVLIYSLTLMMTLICLMSLKDKREPDEESNDLALTKLEGLSQVHPKHAFMLAVCFLSMAGMPPLIGFFPKLLVLKYIISQGQMFLTVFAVITTVISLFYYLKVIKLMYIDMPAKQSIGPSMNVNMQLLWVFVPAVIIQLLGCYVPVLQTLYVQYVTPAAETLIIGSNGKNYS
ncbi:MAG: NADH-quinone oxidoreductase subunit N [Alphaproteobacteria bacterium]|nr:NADH-quinone oxidoreductase subunit N [Alphaproteobacteria bacterium]